MLGSKDWQLLPNHHIGTGVSLKARSGGATNYLAADPGGYPDQIYLLPRGAGPRLPWVFNADVQISYRVALLKGISGLSLTADIFNVLNRKGVTSIDQSYTASEVYPRTDIKTKGDLDKYRSAEDKELAKNTSFGQANGYQTPRVFRFGFRGEF